MEEDQRKGFNTAWTLTLPNISCISEQFKDIQEVISLILHCKTMYCCPMTSPSTSTTSGTLMVCTPSLKVDSSQKEQASKKKQSVFFTAVNPMENNQDLEDVQYDGALISSRRRKDCRFIKLDYMQSLFSTHCLRFVLRKWYTWRLERSYTARYINPKRLPRVVLTPNSQHGRQGPPDPEPTIKVNKACTGKPVAHFSRTHVLSIPEKVSDVCTGKPVAVTLITSFQVYLTQPSRKKIRIAKKPSKDWFNSSRITRTGTR